jgi:transcription-repair coupling factor (superfamily II helicase)
VYFVHNRVESIFSIGGLLQRLVPEAKIGIGHGQMGEDELERAMLGFVERKFDVLLATTIVENGLDIPNANTIIINRADRYGLSQLYQLRGRVGRSDRPAYAYLLTPPQEALSPVARKRLAAIKEFSDLGSGFRVAALDLEIRGAGNLLGGEQSGHIDAVGFDMYMKLLEESVRELKGEDLLDDVRAMVNLRVDLKFDEQYVPDTNQRLMVYRKVARPGPNRAEPGCGRDPGPLRALPSSVLNLVEYGRIRWPPTGSAWRPSTAKGRPSSIRFRQNARSTLFGMVKCREWPGATLVPPVSLKLSLDPALDGAGQPAAEARRRAAGHRPGRRAPAGRRPRPAGGPRGPRPGK